MYCGWEKRTGNILTPTYGAGTLARLTPIHQGCKSNDVLLFHPLLWPLVLWRKAWLSLMTECFYSISCKNTIQRLFSHSQSECWIDESRPKSSPVLVDSGETSLHSPQRWRATLRPEATGKDVRKEFDLHPQLLVTTWTVFCWTLVNWTFCIDCHWEQHQVPTKAATSKCCLFLQQHENSIHYPHSPISKKREAYQNKSLWCHYGNTETGQKRVTSSEAYNLYLFCAYCTYCQNITTIWSCHKSVVLESSCTSLVKLIIEVDAGFLMLYCIASKSWAIPLIMKQLSRCKSKKYW